MTNPFAQLDQLPRVQLAHLPTPIEPLPNLSAHLGGPDLFIKRDDQTGLATGGNKTRKLEFLIAQALAADADTLITAGSTQSNHARQTAAGAARYGLHCHLVLYAPQAQPPHALTGNLLLDHLLGATIHWTTECAPYTNTIAQVEHECVVAGQKPYIIPYGGSNSYGLIGYVVAMLETVMQTQAWPHFDAHVFATSSGGTQAGMLIGTHLAGIAHITALLGISVDRSAADLTDAIISLTQAGTKLLDIQTTLDPALITINDDYLGQGYAVIGEPEREALQLMAQHEGILIDPVYTGRALAGLFDLIRQGTFHAEQRVLFWHTGGSVALFAFANDLGPMFS